MRYCAPPRHTLAVLLWDKTDRSREALDLWRENLAKSADYLPSRLSVAEAWAKEVTLADAAREYEAVVKLRPDYTAARLRLAALNQKQSRADDAKAQLAAALYLKHKNALIFEQIGDLEQSRGRAAEASAAYNDALQNTL